MIAHLVTRRLSNVTSDSFILFYLKNLEHGRNLCMLPR